MLGDNARSARVDVTILNSVKKPLVGRMLFNLNSIPVRDGEFPGNNSDLIYSNLQYTIVYKPSFKANRQDVPFMLEGDMLPNKRIRFGSYQHLLELSTKDKLVNFILRWSNIDEWMIKKARSLLQIRIPVYFNLRAYEEHLKDIIEQETGTRPEDIEFKSAELAEAEEIRYNAYINGKKLENFRVSEREAKEARDNAKY